MSKCPEDVQYLLREFEEINNYNRTFFSIAITWYTFFITANLFVVGLLLSKIMEGRVITPPYLLSLSFLFIFVNVLALVACRLSIRYLRKREERLVAIVEVLNKPDRNNIMCLPFQLSVVVGLERLIEWSLVGMTSFWVAFTILSLT